MAHTHPVVDSDSRFVINSTTRAISTSSDKLELIQGDHQSERITFEIPKIVEGHDMSLSDRIEVHYINIDRRTKATSRDIYITDDMAVDGDKLTFSWLISGNATKYYGRLNFIILFECLDPDGSYTYRWNTEICKLLTVGEGISNTAAVAEDYSDILEKFKIEVLGEAIKDTVKFTEQELSDEEKAQARENIGAEQASRGFVETSLYMQLKSANSKRYFNIYVQEGKIIQFSDSETDNSDVRLAFRDLYLIMNSGSVTYNAAVIQGTVKHYYAAYQAGIIVLPFDCRGSAYSTDHRLIITLNGNTFSVRAIYENGCAYIYDYNIQSNTFSSAIYYGSNIQATSMTALDNPPMVNQFLMSSAPTDDMHIANKKYVDDEIENKAVLSTEQSLTSREKAQALANIGGAPNVFGKRGDSLAVFELVDSYDFCGQENLIIGVTDIFVRTNVPYKVESSKYKIRFVVNDDGKLEIKSNDKILNFTLKKSTKILETIWKVSLESSASNNEIKPYIGAHMLYDEDCYTIPTQMLKEPIASASLFELGSPYHSFATHLRIDYKNNNEGYVCKSFKVCTDTKKLFETIMFASTYGSQVILWIDNNIKTILFINSYSYVSGMPGDFNGVAIRDGEFGDFSLVFSRSNLSNPTFTFSPIKAKDTLLRVTFHEGADGTITADKTVGDIMNFDGPVIGVYDSSVYTLVVASNDGSMANLSFANIIHNNTTMKADTFIMQSLNIGPAAEDATGLWVYTRNHIDSVSMLWAPDLNLPEHVQSKVRENIGAAPIKMYSTTIATKVDSASSLVFEDPDDINIFMMFASRTEDVVLTISGSSEEFTLTPGGRSSNDECMLLYNGSIVATVSIRGTSQDVYIEPSILGVTLTVGKYVYFRADLPKVPYEYIPRYLATKTYVDNQISAEKDVIIKSSTEGSSKKFKITVDDSGTISATEVVQ